MYFYYSRILSMLANCFQEYFWLYTWLIAISRYWSRLPKYALNTQLRRCKILCVCKSATQVKIRFIYTSYLFILICCPPWYICTMAWLLRAPRWYIGQIQMPRVVGMPMTPIRSQGIRCNIEMSSYQYRDPHVKTYKNPQHLDVVDRYLRRIGDKTIPDEALPSMDSFYPPWVVVIDLPQSRCCGFFVLFTNKQKWRCIVS